MFYIKDHPSQSYDRILPTIIVFDSFIEFKFPLSIWQDVFVKTRFYFFILTEKCTPLLHIDLVKICRVYINYLTI